MSTKNKQQYFWNTARDGRIEDVKKLLDDDTVDVDSSDILTLQSFCCIMGPILMRQRLTSHPSHVCMFSWSCSHHQAPFGSWMKRECC